MVCAPVCLCVCALVFYVSLEVLVCVCMRAMPQVTRSYTSPAGVIEEEGQGSWGDFAIKPVTALPSTPPPLASPTQLHPHLHLRLPHPVPKPASFQ